MVAGSPIVPPSRTLEEIDPGRFAPFTLLRNPDALPRWFFPRAVEVIASREIRPLDRGARGRPPGGDLPGRGGLLAAGRRQEPAAAPRPRPARPHRPRRARRAASGCSRPRSSGRKGWSARAGGRRLPILKVDGAFVGVRLPAGASRVELRFLPPA